MKIKILYLFVGIISILSSCSTEENSINATVTDIDGNVYHTVTIGSQVWMVENLKTTRYRDGTSILYMPGGIQWSYLTSGAYCDNNTESNSATYGRLYNWYAVNDSRNIAPAGWHVPTDAEWTTLTTYLGGDSVAGGKLKESGMMHWQSPNSGATNESGFTALPGGDLYSLNGTLYYLRDYGYWWSSTEYADAIAWTRRMHNDISNVYRGHFEKCNGYSVRCLRDY